MAEDLPTRSWCVAGAPIAALLATALCIATPAKADWPFDGPVLPHVLASGGVGGQLRLGRDARLDQHRRAPSYADAMLGFTVPVSGVQAGLSLSGSVNLEPDGGYTEPVFRFQQWSLTPALLLAHPLGRDWLTLGHLGPTFVWVGPTDLPGSPDDGVSLGSGGLELGVAGAYRWLAGVLTYAELNLNVWAGDEREHHWTAALEFGVLLDYEVLP